MRNKHPYPIAWLAVMAVMITGICNAATAVPRPEHPRPDLQRDNWATLNGEWQFEIDKAADGEARGLTYGKDLNSRIIVPFCPESKLSGLALPTSQHMKDVWYRRTFTLPPAMNGKRVRIHFGGVDYRAWVYINGQLAGSHVGENVAFNCEITKFLKAGSNEVVVKVLDDLWSGLQPGGKQSGSDQSAGCFYTRTTGIWQPVWLEAVGSSFIENISVVPDPDNSRVLITAKLNGSDKDLKLTAEAFADGRLTGTDSTTGPWQNTLVINLKEKKLWEPGSPFLYRLNLTLTSGKEKTDELKSYFGLRKITLDGRKFLINGKPVFQRLIWNITKAIDPTRPSLEASGWMHTLPRPEVRDAHDYTGNPESLRKRWVDYFAAPPEGPFPPARYYNPSTSNADRGVPFMISEIGGIGWASEGGWGYGEGPKTLDAFYARYKGTIDAMLENPNLFGFCYTQLTDIEQEKNGLFYYDRKPKFDLKKLHAITARAAAYERGDPVAGQPTVRTLDAKWRVLVGAVQDGKLCTPYKYVTDKPVDDWIKEKFDDNAWKAGPAPFAHGDRARTEWKTPEIYFRKTFQYDGEALKTGAVVIGHNDNTEIYINGQKILGVTGSRGYYLCLVTESLQKALKTGPNTIAVHSHEGGQGQFVDLALLVE